MKRDKLDRWRTTQTALLTLKADVPFWISLTPREIKGATAKDLRRFNLTCGWKRKQFRDFIRSLVK
jgi:hypothetical protein